MVIGHCPLGIDKSLKKKRFGNWKVFGKSETVAPRHDFNLFSARAGSHSWLRAPQYCSIKFNNSVLTN